MVPLDGSKNSLRGLKFAIVFTKNSELLVIGLNVSSIPNNAPPVIIHNIRQKSREIIQEAEKISMKNNVTFAGMIKASNNIGKTIVNTAKSTNVDMIIMGSRGPDPEIGLFLGSVANYAVNKSKVPVTIVK